MRKVLYVLLITFTMSTHINASEYDMFIGVEDGLSWADFNGPTGKYQNHEITTYGVKAGVVNDKTRMYISYQYIDAFEDSTTREGEYQTATINSEAFTEPIDVFNIFDLYFFVGGHAGAIKINVDAAFGKSDEYGFLYGVQAGLLAKLGSVISLETGYRLSRSNFSDQNTDLNKFQVVYGGINFRF